MIIVKNLSRNFSGAVVGSVGSAQSQLVCEWAKGHRAVLEPFSGKVLFSCLSGDPVVWVAMSH